MASETGACTASSPRCEGRLKAVFEASARLINRAPQAATGACRVWQGVQEARDLEPPAGFVLFRLRCLRERIAMFTWDTLKRIWKPATILKIQLLYDCRSCSEFWPAVGASYLYISYAAGGTADGAPGARAFTAGALEVGSATPW